MLGKLGARSSNIAGSISVFREPAVEQGTCGGTRNLSGASDGEMNSGVGAGTSDGGDATGRTCWIGDVDALHRSLGMTIFSIADPRFS